MPVSTKPRRKKGETGGPSPYSVAGTLLHSFYERGELRKRQHRVPTQELMDRKVRQSKRRSRSHHVDTLGLASRRRHLAGPGQVSYASCDPAGSRPAERRKRQGAHLHQHPSVVARFANHPTREQIEEAAARVEGVKTGLVAKVKRAVSRKKVSAA